MSLDDRVLSGLAPELQTNLNDLVNQLWFPDDSDIPVITAEEFATLLAAVGALYQTKSICYRQYLSACRNLAFQLHPFPPTDRVNAHDPSRPSHRVQVQGYYPTRRDPSPNREQPQQLRLQTDIARPVHSLPGTDPNVRTDGQA